MLMAISRAERANDARYYAPVACRAAAGHSRPAPVLREPRKPKAAAIKKDAALAAPFDATFRRAAALLRHDDFIAALCWPHQRQWAFTQSAAFSPSHRALIAATSLPADVIKGQAAAASRQK